MRYLFGTLLLLFVAASVALVAARNSGYVMIVREPIVLETSLVVFLLLLLALFAGFYFVMRLAARILRAPESLERWRLTRRSRQAREGFQAGLVQALRGEWVAAEQTWLSALHGADAPFLVWTALAIAAQEQNDRNKRDRYLARAQEHADGQTLTGRLVQAQLQVLSGQREPALATLVDLYSTHPRHADVARRLLTVYRDLHDWHGLTRLLHELRHLTVLSEAERRPYEIAAHRALLSLHLPTGARTTLDQAWNALSPAMQQEPELVRAYAHQLLGQQGDDTAVTLLTNALDRDWNEDLLRLYGEAHGSQPQAQLDQAVEWLAQHGEQPALLLALGRLACRAGQLERAQHWLQQCLARDDNHAAETELGKLYEAKGDKDQALTHYRRALGAQRRTAPS